jgi:hypothetical protein
MPRRGIKLTGLRKPRLLFFIASVSMVMAILLGTDSGPVDVFTKWLVPPTVVLLLVFACVAFVTLWRERRVRVLTKLREWFAGPYPFSPNPLDVLAPPKDGDGDGEAEAKP